MTSQNIKKYLRTLGRNPEYTDLFNQVTQLNKMQQMLTTSTVIPIHLIKHCQLGQITRGRLTLLAENASVAAKLKHISPSILQKIQNLGWEITAIKILVQKPGHTSSTAISHPVKTFHLKKTKISNAGIECLNRLTLTLPDSELKNSIQRLLKNHA
ncbi:DciA family protein [Nitrosomonas aestuarii]|uniref:DciA family protein n=1 Tax=Nitrosomonas aestuarii TaxID=52441 RepID=UPI000D320BD9|nr:uncharacterized protein DUF721 [Nitrosomonas aestuarii]